MITENIIKIRYILDGVHLSAKTEKGNYGQYYNMKDKTKPSFAIDLKTAIKKFMAFYNKFEEPENETVI